jgi:predicted membrane metal-binding protein
VTAYAGGAWLLLVPLAVSLLLTAALVWVRWRTCLDERDDRRPAVAAHPQLDSAKAG